MFELLGVLVIKIGFVLFLLVCSDLGEQLQQAKQSAEQFKSMLQANESLLSDLNKVSCIFKNTRNRPKQTIAWVL